MPRKYSQEVKDFVASNVKGLTNKELTELVNKKFGPIFTVSKIKAFKANHKFKSERPKGLPAGHPTKQYPAEIKEFIENNYKGTGPKAMMEMLNIKFGTNYTYGQINNYYCNHGINSGLTGHFQKGHIPFNKGKHIGGWEPTQFKKGHMPVNHRPVGSERITVDGYVEVKTEEPKKWRGKHIVVREEVHGKIPKGHCLIFLDGDKQNCNPDNLMMITRAQLARMNQMGLFNKDKDITRTGALVAELITLAGKRKKEASRD